MANLFINADISPGTLRIFTDISPSTGRCIYGGIWSEGSTHTHGWHQE